MPVFLSGIQVNQTANKPTNESHGIKLFLGTEKLISTQLVKKVSEYYGRTCLPVAAVSILRNVYGRTEHFPQALTRFVKIHVNILLPSTPRSSKFSLLFRFSNQNFEHFSGLSVSHTRVFPSRLIVIIFGCEAYRHASEVI